ncbi:MAG: tRNA (adenosine(37)-N6)-dimethylallyltransferase MiaA [Pseudomonadota bacterium]
MSAPAPAMRAPALRTPDLPDVLTALSERPADAPVLIAGPTGSGKSALALALAEATEGVVVNADALQVYREWRVLTARPSAEDEARAPHRLYGHIGRAAPYSAGHWLREVAPILSGPQRAILVGGTGLYFRSLTEGLADIPDIPAEIRAEASVLSPEQLRQTLDAPTLARIDRANPARLRRAWEVLRATGHGLAHWQDATPPALLPEHRALCLVIDAPKVRLTPRLEQRFDAMLAGGALEEVAANLDGFDPQRPGDRAIGAAELAGHLRGETDLDTAREAAVIATRRYAKRQRTWFRARMAAWRRIAMS